MPYNIINSSQQLRDLTGSWYQNNDFSRIQRMLQSVELDMARTLGAEVMQWIATEGSGTDAWVQCATAIGLMATMRYQQLNDISHEDQGRKVKMDRENEARPFEWQLARDDRMHLEEYYRALDRLLFLLEQVEVYRQSEHYRQRAAIIVQSARTVAWVTGVNCSEWLFLQLVPLLAESQHFTEKAYGERFTPEAFCPYENTGTLNYAAQKATALGALSIMGRRTQLQQLPWALMSEVLSDGGGNRQQQPVAEAVAAYLKRLDSDQHYWINEMQTLRDAAARNGDYTHLHMPDNSPENPFMRL
jgi:hypothetical protein